MRSCYMEAEKSREEFYELFAFILHPFTLRLVLNIKMHRAAVRRVGTASSL